MAWSQKLSVITQFRVDCLLFFRNMLTSLATQFSSFRSRSSANSSSVLLQQIYSSSKSVLAEVRLLADSFSAPADHVMSSSPLSPLLLSVDAEARDVADKLELVRSDVAELLSVIDGLVAATPLAQDALLSLSKRRVPRRWWTRRWTAEVDVADWMSALRSCASAVDNVGSALTTGQRVVVCELGLFGRPSRFVDAVRRHLARQQFKSLHTSRLMLEVSVLADFCVYWFIEIATH